jgi:hypothetical protein
VTRVLIVFLGMLLTGMVLFFAIDWYHPIANPEACGRAWGRLTALVVIVTAVYEVSRYMAKGRPGKDPPLPWAPATPPARPGHQAPSGPPGVPACSGEHQGRVRLACPATPGMDRKEPTL